MDVIGTLILEMAITLRQTVTSIGWLQGKEVITVLSGRHEAFVLSRLRRRAAAKLAAVWCSSRVVNPNYRSDLLHSTIAPEFVLYRAECYDLAYALPLLAKSLVRSSRHQVCFIMTPDLVVAKRPLLTAASNWSLQDSTSLSIRQSAIAKSLVPEHDRCVLHTGLSSPNHTSLA